MQARSTSAVPTTTPTSPTSSAQSPASTPPVSPNPSVGSGYSWGYQENAPPLFNGQPKPSDVIQGSVGDCFLDAALAELADKNPQLLQNDIQTVPNTADPSHPNYAVTLFDQQGKPQVITVDGQQFMSGNSVAGAGRTAGDNGPPAALWPAIYEKAYAIQDSSPGKTFQQILDGGNTTPAWQVLTGQEGQGTQRDTAAQVGQALSGNGLLGLQTAQNFNSVPSTFGTNNRYTVAPGAFAAGQNFSTTPGVTVTDTQTKQSYEFLEAHEYSVLGYSTNPPGQDPSKADPSDVNVMLYNPWGTGSTQKENVQSVPLAVLLELGFEDT